MSSDKDIEDIREEKLRELKNQQNESESNAEEQKQEQARDKLLRKILTEDARKRLKNVSLVDEDKATEVENILIRMCQQNQIHAEVTCCPLATILATLYDGYPVISPPINENSNTIGLNIDVCRHIMYWSWADSIRSVSPPAPADMLLVNIFIISNRHVTPPARIPAIIAPIINPIPDIKIRKLYTVVWLAYSPALPPVCSSASSTFSFGDKSESVIYSIIISLI